MSERREFGYRIPDHRLESMATVAALELETAQVKYAIVYSLKRFKLVEVTAVKLRGGGENDRRFCILTDDRQDWPKDYSYSSISSALYSVLLDQTKDARRTIRTALINLKAGESIKISRDSS